MGGAEFENVSTRQCSCEQMYGGYGAALTLNLKPSKLLSAVGPVLYSFSTCTNTVFPWQSLAGLLFSNAPTISESTRFGSRAKCPIRA